MLSFSPDQWLLIALVFVMGLFLGMALLASPKWKTRYREEVRKREALETENAQLRKDAREMESLRHAAARDEVRTRETVVPAASVPVTPVTETRTTVVEPARPVTETRTTNPL